MNHTTTHPAASTLHPGSDYTADELEFIAAMETYMKEKRRKFPAFTEVLAVARSLGYQKVKPTKSDR